MVCMSRNPNLYFQQYLSSKEIKLGWLSLETETQL